MRAAAGIVAVCVGAMWSSAGLAQTSITRTSSFAYVTSSGLLNREVVEPDIPAESLTTVYIYDAFGNKIQATVSGPDIGPARISKTVYDPRGQFATKNINALGHTETWEFKEEFGKPSSQTGPNGLTTTWSYDSFGRKTLEVRADGTGTAFSYQFCSGVNGGTATCVAGASYLIQATPLAADLATQNGPLGSVYFDALNREIGRDTQGFDGGTVRALRQYDSMGRVQQTSRPFFVASATPKWTTYTYDTLGRVTGTTQPDGSVATQVYHGLVTSETNALAQTRTITRNARGEVVSVTDALNQTMTYAYDPVGNLVRTTDAAGNVVIATYDLRGRNKIGSSDPDLGIWTYFYNALGELVQQTDAKGQTTAYAYDKLGRLWQRTEADMTSAWAYGTVAPAIGKLASASITAGRGNGYQRAYGYDPLGRPSQVATTVDGTVRIFNAAYDADGRLSAVTYPSGFVARYGYTALGYSNQLADNTSGQVHWTANALDAEQHITSQTAGNNLVTTRDFDALTGRLRFIRTGAVQNVSYTYDLLGNPLTRVDSKTAVSESFAYDQLNRLTTATVSTRPTKTYTYDAIGNMLSKSDVGLYSYAPPGGPRPHAVTGIDGDVLSTTFYYDANGNQTEGLGRSIAWTAANKPLSITQGTRVISFEDDIDHQRFKQVTPQGTTLYYRAFGVLAELVTGATSARWNEYLSVGNQMVGVRFVDGVGTATPTVLTRYFHTDHLGSIALLTNEAGALAQRLSYDPWGKRRFNNGADDFPGSLSSTTLTTRGFTGEEELSIGGLVHLNGRVYDPMLARMVSADPVVPDALNAQAWNRYSYVGNSPLTFTDPSGHSWLSSFFGSVGSFFKSILSNPIVRAVVQIGLTFVVGPVIAAMAVTGLAGGDLGDMLRAGAIAGATALAFNIVGTATVTVMQASGAEAAQLFNIAAHAGVGCLSAVASGGKCGPGALAGGVSAAAGPFAPRDLVGGTVVRGAIGGLASVAGGGKFENGAVTGAFGYLFGSMAAQSGELRDGNYAQTYIDFWGKVRVDYFDGYYELDPISQESVRIHEAVHVEQLQAATKEGWPFWGLFGNHRATWGGTNALELPAYRAQVDFLDGTLGAVPRTEWTLDYQRADLFRQQQLVNLWRVEQYQRRIEGK